MTQQSINNATVNNATTKEDEVMKRAIIIVDAETNESVETTLDAMTLEELIAMKELTKDIVRAYLEEEGVTISNNEFKRTKRADLVASLYAVMHPTNSCDGCEHEFDIDGEPYCRCEDLDRECVKQFMGVPVGDLSITHDNAPDTTVEDMAICIMLTEAALNTRYGRDRLSNHMLKSALYEALYNKTLTKRKEDGKFIKGELNVFTDEQNAEAKALRDTIIVRDGFMYKISKDDYIWKFPDVYMKYEATFTFRRSNGDDVHYDVDFRNRLFTIRGTTTTKRLTRENFDKLKATCVLTFIGIRK